MTSKLFQTLTGVVLLLQLVLSQIHPHTESQYTSYVTKSTKNDVTISGITSSTPTELTRTSEPSRQTTTSLLASTPNSQTTDDISESESQRTIVTHTGETVTIPIIGTVTATAKSSVVRDFMNDTRRSGKAINNTITVPSKVPVFGEGRVATSIISPRGPICDFCLYEGEGNFTSYGYPLPYRAELDCTYRVKRVSDDECQLEIIFHVFDLQGDEISDLRGRGDVASDTCNHDFLAVAGRRFCGRDHQGRSEVVPFERSLSEITFNFHSDRQVSGKGFWIEVRRRPGSCPPANEKSPSAESCGPTDFLDKESILTSPNFPEDYGDDVDCRYVFRQVSPDVCGLEITFLRFDVEQSDGCIYDFLEINGERICGSLPPNAIKVFMFNEYEKLVRFVTDRQTTRSGFSLRTRQITDCHPQNELPPPPNCAICSDRPEGDISSYGYPDDYRNNLLCTYTVDRFSPQMCRLQLDFIDFDVHYTPDCDADYLMIDGRRLCGSQHLGERQLLNFGNKGSLVFVFKTDGSTVRKGFHLRYRQLPCFEPLEPTESSSSRASCDMDFKDRIFTMESPEHPEMYPNDLDCKYKITKSSDNVCQLKVTFVTFDVEDNVDNDTGGTCQNDYLLVQGENDKLCGNLPADFTKTYNFDTPEKTIQFHSDSATGRPGFLARVEQVECSKETKEPSDTGSLTECDQTIEDLQADIFSPGYPTQYENGLDCRYTIRKDSAIDICRLQITFRDFSIQTGDVCQYDFLQVDNFKLCGSTPEGTQRSYDFRGSELRMLFHTDANETNKGFHITIRQIPCQSPTVPSISTTSTTTVAPLTTTLPSGIRVPESCDAVFTEKEFMLKSSSYPDSYPEGVDCRYLILKNSPNVCALELTFVDFKLEEDENCVADYFEVDNNRFCGKLPSRARRTFTFDTATKTIYFHSDSMHYDFGFKVIARQIDCEEEEPTTRPTRRPTTTTQRPRPTYPTTPTYYTKPPAKVCRQYIREKDSVVKSPSYPNKYPNNLNCSYVVVKASANICELKVQVLNFDVESSSGCEYDYLLIEGERLCGTLPTNMTRIYDFRNRQKIIRFNSDAASSRTGFRIKLKQLPCRGTSSGSTDYPVTSPISNKCDRVYTGRRFAIRSEGYPKNYERNLDCRYTIRKYSSNVCALEVEFAAFAIESSDRCTNDYLEIDNKRFCGTLPRTAKRTFDFLPFEKVIRFKSNNRQSGPGYLLRVRQIDCGTLTTPVIPQPSIPDIPRSPCVYSFKDISGRFNSLNYPNPYPRNSMCKFKIEALPGFCNVELSFPTFQLKPSGGSNLVCYEDYVEINGVRYCGEQLQGHTKTVVFEDKWNAVVIQMVSDNYDEGRGFDATYRQIPCNSYKTTPPYEVSTRSPTPDIPEIYCDRFLGSQTFVFTNPELPSSARNEDEVDNVIDCRYTVPQISNRFCKLRLRFQLFDIATDNGCEYDFLEINEQRLCGRLPSTTVREYDFSNAQVLIRYHTENPYSSRFKIDGEQVDCTVYPTKTPSIPPYLPTETPPPGNCDRKISSTEFEISSFNYPNGYPQTQFCRYIIEKQDKNVCGLELNFVRFEIQDSHNCLRDYFSIEDRKICGTLAPHTTRTYDFFDHEKLLYFRSDSDINGPGFFIEGRQVFCRSPFVQPTSGNTPHLPSTPVFPEKPPEPFRRPSCDRFFIEEEFVIETPTISDNNFPRDMHCRFGVRRLNNNVCALDLTFIKFDMEDDMPLCRSDYLEISSDALAGGQFNRRNGRPPFRLCGRMTNFAFRRIEFILPETEKIFIFHTDRALVGKGFAIRVHQSSDCGPQDNLWMPLIPQRFPPRSFPIDEPRVPSRLPCEVCRRQLEGKIESPHYPAKYPNNIHCEYHLERLPGFCAIELIFTDFQIEKDEPKRSLDPTAPCVGDYLEIEGRRFCGFMLNGVTKILPFPPGELSQVKLILATDQLVGGRGFQAEYKQLPCRDTRATADNTHTGTTASLVAKPNEKLVLKENGNTNNTTYPEIRPRNS